MLDIAIIPMVAGGILAVVIGFIWYSPRAFGSMWMQTVHFTPESVEVGKKKMPLMILVAFAAAMILAWLASQFAMMWGALTIGSALELGFWIWLGFMMPVALSPVLWEQKPLKHFFINGGYWLVTAQAITITAALLI